MALGPPQRPPGRPALTRPDAPGAVGAGERQRAAAPKGHGEPGAGGRNRRSGGGRDVVLGPSPAGEGPEHRPLELLDGGRDDDVPAGGARAPVSGAAAPAAPAGLGLAAGAAALRVGGGRGGERPGAAAGGGLERRRGGNCEAVRPDGADPGVRGADVAAGEERGPVVA